MAEGMMAGQGRAPGHAIAADLGHATAYDSAMLAELEDVFGRDHLMQLLSLLKAEIGGRLRHDNDDRTALGRDAHALLSSSGSLGFLDLSHRCSDIERACLDGTDLSGPLREARAAARWALAAITALEAGG